MQQERQQEQVAEQPSTTTPKTTTPDKHIQDASTSQTTDSGKESQLKLLQRLSNMAQTKGRETTWKWLQHQIDSGGPGLLVLSKGQQSLASNPTTTTTTDASNKSERALLPHPRRHFKSAQQAVQTERQHVSFYRHATHVVPFAYHSYSEEGSSPRSENNISITVRRPYAKETRATWIQLSNLTAENYARRAHISKATALEVVILLKCDATQIPLVFLCSGGNDNDNNNTVVRYRTHPGGALQVKKGNATSLSSSSLGLYYGYQKTDSSHDDKNGGGYQTYDLDDLLRQAIWVREQYCSAVTSTALGLRLQAAQLAAEKEAEEKSESVVVPSRTTTIDTATATTMTMAIQTQNASVDTSDFMPAVVEETIPKENTAIPSVPPTNTTPPAVRDEDPNIIMAIKTRSFMEETEKSRKLPKSILDYSLNDVIRWASKHRLLSPVAGNRKVLRVLLSLALFALLYLFGIQHYIGFGKQGGRELGGDNE
jgi:hypothetical protein